MKVAFPVNKLEGLQSPVYSHFGSARGFVVIDVRDGAMETLSNQDLGHAHGDCQPHRALGGQPVDAVVVGGIGLGALQKLGASGVEVYRGVEGTVAENLALFKAGRLPPFQVQDTCAGHGQEGGCAHT